MDLTFLISLFLAGLTLYWYFKTRQSHWTKQRVPSVPGALPIFGHMLPSIIAEENITEFVQKAYKNFDASMIGFFFIQKPGIIVRDPELVKQVVQTKYTSFRHNLWVLNKENDPIFAKHPFFTDDFELWRQRRSRIASHLSGKLLRYISVVMNEVCDRMHKYIERKIQKNGRFHEGELKDLFMRCTSELIANCAFAIEGQSFEDNPNHMSFTKVAERLLESTLINDIKQSLIFHMPGVAKFLGLSFLQKSSDTYIRQNIEAILKQSQRMGNAPRDFLQARVESDDDLDEILADVTGFFFDDHETSDTALANTFYHLSKNSEIQSKLRDHVRSVLKKTGGQLSYESLKEMPYLDQVVQEGLRIIPPVGVLMKSCTEEVTLRGSDGLTCHLIPGNPVFIPVLGLHTDEKYWPNPEDFNPDRFNLENQANINKYTFMSFGQGPKMCVGFRLGLMVVKYVTASLVTTFSVEHSSKTRVPLEIEPTPLMLGFKGGLWARFQILDQPLQH